MGRTVTITGTIYAPQHPDGYIIGDAAADLVALHGAAGVAQAATASAVATTVATTAATTTTPYGFTGTAQFNDLITEVGELKTLSNALRTALVNKGIIASS